MARYRKTKKYIIRKRTKYSPNILDIGPDTITFPSAGWFGTSITLATNPTQSNLTTSSVTKVKNFEVAIDFTTGINNQLNVENLQFYIMFVPEDMAVDTNYPLRHPEYILAYRYYGGPGIENTSGPTFEKTFKVRTRMARNLNTGDKVILYLYTTSSCRCSSNK